jgi:hypothetical protein
VGLFAEVVTRSERHLEKPDSELELSIRLSVHAGGMDRFRRTRWTPHPA